MRKLLYPYLDHAGSAAPSRAQREASQPLTDSNCASHMLSRSFTPQIPKSEADLVGIRPYSCIPGAAVIERGSAEIPSLSSHRNHNADVSRNCSISRCLHRVAHPCPTTSQHVQRAGKVGSTIGIDQHEDSHLIEKYIVTLTHTLEKRFRMHYTYWCGITGYLLFLKLLVISSSDRKRNAFDLVTRRRMD